MAKRVSEQTRIINQAFAAESREEIDSIIETLKGVRDNRFPVKKVAPRKERKDKGTARGLPKGTGEADVVVE